MITGFFTGVLVAIPTSLVAMKLLNSSLFIDNQELRHINEKVSILIHQLEILVQFHCECNSIFNSPVD